MSTLIGAAAYSVSFDRRLAAEQRGVAPQVIRAGDGSAVTIRGRGLEVELDPSRVDFHVSNDRVTLFLGLPLNESGSASLSARSFAERKPPGAAGDSVWTALRGRFSAAEFDLSAATATFATDRFAVYPLCYSVSGSRIAASDRADAVPVVDGRTVDPQAVFNYVYFHVIPSPRTIFREVQRLGHGSRLLFDAQGTNVSPIWRPRFESDGFSVSDLKKRFPSVIAGAVRRQVRGERVGCFLSGGTDSSTIAGMLGQVTGRPPSTFSVGFDAAGYDEMEYARIAAKHFGADSHELYLTPADLVGAIPLVARHYDQPFGNSSAVAAYKCAEFARSKGVELLLAGDGGDELFGGNSRYGVQNLFELYYGVPEWMRRSVIEPSLPHLPRQLRKVASYVRQAKMAMPDRMESYNLLARFTPEKVFAGPFLAQVSLAEPLALQRAVYWQSGATSIVDRMLEYDWRFTLADNDLPKVTETARLAGVGVGFPLLDDDLVDLSLRLPPQFKVRGTELRRFFKDALSDFLPPAIIKKKKHGFGLPFGPWLRDDASLRALARESLEQLCERGLIRKSLVSDLFSSRIDAHAGYYGEMIWVLMILAQWLSGRAAHFRVH